MKTIARILKAILWRFPFPLFEKIGIHVLPVHYYSPVPDTRELKRTVKQWYVPSRMRGVDLKEEAQACLLEELTPHLQGGDGIPDFAEAQKGGWGAGYGEVEARLLWAMVRRFRPRTIIEVGAGVSTVFSLRALERNGGGRIIAIEPEPSGKLKELAGPVLEVVPRRVQDVPMSEFEGLRSGDILFIDSSHVSRLGGDVDHLYLEVVPSLKPGVFVHVHDISLPYPCPEKFDHWVFGKHQFWNENALVHAFLCFNSAFEVVLATSYLNHARPELMARSIPGYDRSRHSPASLWLRRRT